MFLDASRRQSWICGLVVFCVFVDASIGLNLNVQDCATLLETPWTRITSCDPPPVCSLWSSSNSRAAPGSAVSCNSVGRVVQLLYYPTNNIITSTLPESWSNLTSLVHLVLSNYKMHGTLPSSWGRLVNLKQLKLDGNELSGSLPASWSTLANLQKLDLSKNRLHGTLPGSWGALKNLEKLLIADNPAMCGQTPNQLRPKLDIQELPICQERMDSDNPGDGPPGPEQLLQWELLENPDVRGGCTRPSCFCKEFLLKSGVYLNPFDSTGSTGLICDWTKPDWFGGLEHCTSGKYFDPDARRCIAISTPGDRVSFISQVHARQILAVTSKPKAPSSKSPCPRLSNILNRSRNSPQTASRKLHKAPKKVNSPKHRKPPPCSPGQSPKQPLLPPTPRSTIPHHMPKPSRKSPRVPASPKVSRPPSTRPKPSPKRPKSPVKSPPLPIHSPTWPSPKYKSPRIRVPSPLRRSPPKSPRKPTRCTQESCCNKPLLTRAKANGCMPCPNCKAGKSQTTYMAGKSRCVCVFYGTCPTNFTSFCQ